MEDHYTCTDIDAMESIAKKLPLSSRRRPQWDLEVLNSFAVSKVKSNLDAWKQVWSEEEKINYNSTPMFSIYAIK